MNLTDFTEQHRMLGFAAAAYKIVMEIKTPKTHPDHHVVGHYFAGYSCSTGKTEIYFCDSYDSRIGYWMTNVNESKDRKNISERAIGRTFMEAVDKGSYWRVDNWGKQIAK